jgi:hypothetical protein
MMDFEVALAIVVLNFGIMIAFVTMNFQTTYCIDNFSEENQYEGLIQFQTLNKKTMMPNFETAQIATCNLFPSWNVK